MENIESTAARSTTVVPFLKWAGGKRWLTRLSELELVRFKGTYYEPFLGSGALFFCLNPKAAILSDTNVELVEAYIAIKNDWRAVLRLLKQHQQNHSAEYYYQMRDKVLRSDAGRAARFIYLNRTCWNGLYRVNKNGVFNVPVGTKTSVLLNTDDFCMISKRLNASKLLCSDFEAVINKAKSGDFIFADPPYTVRHNFNGFIKYNEKLFSWDDQVRLQHCLLKAAKRGVDVLMTNADHESIRELYRSKFFVERTSRFSAISGTAVSRGDFSELIISTWRLGNGF